MDLVVVTIPNVKQTFIQRFRRLNDPYVMSEPYAQELGKGKVWQLWQFQLADFGNLNCRIGLKHVPSLVKRAHVLQASTAKAPQPRQLSLQSFTNTAYNPCAPIPLTRIDRNEPHNAIVKRELFLIDPTRSTCLALQNLSLDDRNRIRQFGRMLLFYFNPIIHTQRLLTPAT